MIIIIRAFILSFIAGLSSIIGFFLTYIKINKDQESKIITICLAISLIVLLYLSIFDLIPNGFIYSKPFLSLILISSGVGVVFILNRSKNDNSLLKLGILCMITLIIHNVPEGIITFISNIHNNSMGLKLTLGILIHNIPEGILIALPIYYGTKSHFKSFIYTFIAGISEPLGGFLIYLLLKDYLSIIIIKYLLLIVGGMMIYLSSNIILKKCINYHEYQSIEIGISIGIIIIILMHIYI